MIVKSHTATRELDAGRHMILRQIGWQAFEQILQALPSRRLRAAYSRGDLEIMSPLPIHEALKTFFGYFFGVIAEELEVVMRCLGSTTYRNRSVDHGIEPDQSYYFKSFVLVRNWLEVDLDHDPPPDLAIEVEVTSTILNRIAIYESLRVPELWRCNEEELQVLHLDESGKYQPATASVVLPFLPVDELIGLFHRLRNVESDGVLLRSLRQWVRERVEPLYRAYIQKQS